MNRQDDIDFINREKYFSDGICESGNINGVDMAFHSGAEWWRDSKKVNLLYELVERGIHLRILLNTPETSEVLAKHMRHKRKIYVSFEDCIRKWEEFKKEYPDNVDVRVTDIPILRRYYSFHMKDICMDTVNVKYYTYANDMPEKNCRSIFYCDSEYFGLYRDEFEYLWNHTLSNIGKEEG